MTPANVAEVGRVVRPYAVDVASGVESSPAWKGPAKMRRCEEVIEAALAPGEGS